MVHHASFHGPHGIRHLRSRRSGIVGGAVLLLIGLFFLLGNLNIYPEGFYFADWWPLILIVIGLAELVKHGRVFHFGSWILILLGFGFLCAEQGLFNITWGNMWDFWPVILILIGLSILTDHKHSSLSNKTAESESE